MPYMIVTAIIAIFVAILALQNSMMVNLNFLAWSFEMNLVLVVFISAIAGFLISFIWGLKLKARGLWNVHKLNERIARLEEDKSVLSARVDELLQARGTTAAEVVEQGTRAGAAESKKV
ncbi:MAG: LapA family protein [Succiniclasticum sp.]|nr:LapA family protein [Succiniclasticum sp.]MCI6222550.1 LapA family protein [Selenomonadales bacterium]MDY6303716.1 LapA family protein [Succiniclasticum sp.]MDY6345699.1 LapA family protein [Succiniclasticum sp.]